MDRPINRLDRRAIGLRDNGRPYLRGKTLLCGSVVSRFKDVRGMRNKHPVALEEING